MKVGRGRERASYKRIEVKEIKYRFLRIVVNCPPRWLLNTLVGCAYLFVCAPLASRGTLKTIEEVGKWGIAGNNFPRK